MILDRILYVLRSIRFSGIYQAIKYGYLRDQIDRPPQKNRTTGIRIDPGSIEKISHISNGIQIEFSQASIEIISLSPNLVRISWTPGEEPIDYTLQKKEWLTFSAEVIKNDTEISYKCDNVRISILNTGELHFQNPNGSIYKRDLTPFRNNECWTLSSTLSTDEHIYGLGERAACLNLRNGSYRSWNTDAGGNYSSGSDPLYIGTPIYLSINEAGSHLVYHENSYESNFSINDRLTATFSGGMLRYYVLTGSLSTIYSELGDLVGYPYMPPLWSLGYHQCRWGYRTDNDIREVVQGFKEKALPLSAIHLDIDYMDHFKVFSVNKASFPSLKNLTDDLRENGVKVVVSINPAVKLDKKNHVYNSGKSNDVFCRLPSGKIMRGVSWPGWSVFPDFTKLEAREWWKAQYQYLVNQGVAGIWHDMNEPASFAAWGDKTFPLNTIHNMDGREGNHREAHNIYGLLMCQSAFEGLRKIAPTRRPWIFSRSGWAGLQRYAWNWTGDIESTWLALRQTIPTILGLGISGHAFSGVDIGGFSGNPDAELYLRWFQMAAFLPLFRTHSAIGTKSREPWCYGEPNTSIVRKFAQLRYQLLPYFYSLAWQTTKTGIPPIRPIFWIEPSDRSLWDIDDEFMVGDSILVAPVLHQAQGSRKVTLPAGEWISYWDDQRYRGPCQVELSVTLETIPIFIKGGASLPMDENGALCFQVYTSVENIVNNELYSDAGDGYGDFRVDSLEVLSDANETRIVWKSQGNYSFPYEGVKFHVHGPQISKIFIDGKPETKITNNTFHAAQFSEARLIYFL